MNGCQTVMGGGVPACSGGRATTLGFDPVDRDTREIVCSLIRSSLCEEEVLKGELRRRVGD